MNRKKIIPITCIVFATISALIVIYFIVRYIKEDYELRAMEDELQTDFKFALPLTSIDWNTEKSVKIDWNALQEQNDDVVGWISFDEPSVIDYPIVQGESNQAYLNHNWKGEKQSAGSIFLHKSNRPDFMDQNSIIYGHRMINGSMFGSLKKFSSQEYMNKNRQFYIETPDGQKRTYEILLYAKVKDSSIAYQLNFKNIEWADYWDYVSSNAITAWDTPISDSDKLVTLSTCSGKGYYDRMILIGQQIAITKE